MEMSQSLLHVVDTAWVGHAFGSVAVSGMHGFAAIGLAAIQPGMLFETGYGAPCCLRYGMVHHIFVQTSIYNMHIAISCSIIKNNNVTNDNDCNDDSCNMVQSCDVHESSLHV